MRGLKSATQAVRQLALGGVFHFRNSMAWLCIALLMVSAAHAAPPETVAGLAWMRAQVQADGSLINAASSAATAEQAEAEVARTAALLAGQAAVPGPLIQRLSDAREDTELLARAAVALTAAGANAGPILGTLSSRQNQDGGFGAAQGAASNTLDTVWACQAFAVQPSMAGTQVCGWLLSRQEADGGLLAGAAGERIQATALAVEALQGASSDLRTQGAVLRMASWLQGARAANGSWRDSIYLTALGLYALTLQAVDDGARSDARQWLVSRQASNGSWGNDPFLTAVVLRALASEPPASPQAADITGRIVDAAGAPIAGASVELSGAAARLAVSGADGSFRFSTLAGGNYLVAASAAGYASQQRSVALTQGQSFDLGAIVLPPASGSTPVMGTIEGTISSSTQGPLQGARVALSGSASLEVFTDAQGRYRMDNVAPGTIDLQASASGHHAAAATASIAAGQTLVFSPILVESSAPPPSTAASRLIGHIVSLSGAPLASATVEVDGSIAGTADGAGRFDVPVAVGARHVRFQASGYVAAESHVVVSQGMSVDFGKVVLSPLKTESDLSGRVTDESTDAPIAGAEVAVAGAGRAVTDPSGFYALTGLAGSVFELTVQAPGYLAQSWRVETSVPASIRKDFALSPGGQNLISLSSVLVSQASVGPNTAVSVSASVSNQGSSARDIVLQLLVLDASGQAIDLAPAHAAGGGNPLLGAFPLAAGAQQQAWFDWNSGQFPAGQYRLLVRAVQAGTISRDLPQGQVLATRSATLAVTAAAQFTGSVAATPPVLRANAGTPVRFSAVIRSSGNLPLPAQRYRLSVVDEKNGETLATLETAAAELAPSAPTVLNFQDWVPTRPGSFVLTVVAASGADHGKALGKLYAGDTAVGRYEVDKTVVPTGSQPVRASIRITGEDAATGGVQNPLSVAIKAAIQ